MVIIFVFLQASGPHGSQGLVAPKAKYQSHNYAIFVSKIYERCSTVLLLPWQISLRHGGALGSVLHHASEKRTWPRLPCVIPKGTFLNYYLRLRWFGIPSPVRHHSSLRPRPSSPRRGDHIIWGCCLTPCKLSVSWNVDIHPYYTLVIGFSIKWLC